MPASVPTARASDAVSAALESAKAATTNHSLDQHPQPTSSSSQNSLAQSANFSPPTSILKRAIAPVMKQMDGIVKLYWNASDAGTMWAKWAAQSERIHRRDGIRMVLRTVQDLKIIFPAIPYLVLPFKTITLPFVFRTVPILVPTAYYTKEVMIIKAATVETKRGKSASIVVNSLANQINTMKLNDSRDQSALAALSSVRKMMLNTSSITYADLNTLLCPLFIAKLTASSTLESPTSFASFLNFTFPFVFPRQRLLQWADWIIKDDGMLRRDGIGQLSWYELVEALEERGFTRIDPQTVTEDEMRHMLAEHVRFTKNLMDSIVAKRQALAVASGSMGSDFKVSEHLGLTGEELGGLATLLVFARAVDVLK
ncbi:hypothetical protein HDU83_001580 [Entophlyctis luteolus]|nr:hypothetical protein HDU83_001580 [Entophlyctis luteolus]KAJ3387675.1 hypothetical protein HDU84_000627 [Entophlyctis sp. JEL0112]